MKRRIHNIGKSALLALALVMAFGVTDTVAQDFNDLTLPKLSLTGKANGYDEDWYPDGRLRIPQSDGVEREFLVPVFFSNNWDPEVTFPIIDQNPGATNGDLMLTITPELFTSFEFSFYYDSSAVRFIDVVTTGQIHNLIEGEAPEDWEDPIAADWDMSVYTRKDNSYLEELFPQPISPVDAGKGWKGTVTGVSSTPLPVTGSRYEVLLYLKFQAVPDVTNPNTPATSLKTPLYIANDTIKYNDINIAKDHPLDRYRDVFTTYTGGLLYTSNDEYERFYQQTPRQEPRFYNGSGALYRGTAGINNFDNQNQNPDIMQPGMIYVTYMDQIPRISLVSDRGGSQGIFPVPETTPLNEAEQLILTDPITTGVREPDPNYRRAIRELTVSNSVNESRLRYLEIETDQEWLLIEPSGNNTNNNFNKITDRKYFVNYLDNNFLGNTVLFDPENNLTDDDGDLILNIVADPTKLNGGGDENVDDSDPEKAGRYVGHISFYSPDAKISPVILEVTFIYFRMPEEACERAAGVERGIKLDLRNSSNQLGDRTRIIFGTGNRATSWEDNVDGMRGVDTLFGEYHYEQPGNGFWARFYPSLADGSIPDGYENTGYYGYGDWNPNGQDPHSSSRDIRSSDAAQKSHIYHVKFDANGDNNYPVVMSWDIRDFRICDDENGNEQQGTLFLKDTENGRLFDAINMLDGTVISQFGRSYSFQDPEIDEFLIEYTLPNVIEFVDETGAPIIKRGWNLLSLPVNPTNKEKQNVFTEAISGAYSFEGRDYKISDDEDNLEVGRGYFVKYGTDIDSTFAGTTINSIAFPQNKIRVDEESWNLVGSISKPVPVEEISFAPYNGREANIDYTLQYGVWGYVTGMGYEEVSVILPGRGYWIKTDNDSYYQLCEGGCKQSDVMPVYPAKEAIRNSAAVINVSDVAGQAGKVYFSNNDDINTTHFGMPPVPASNLFDVRFNTDKQLTNSTNELIKVSGAQFPLTISMDRADADYEFFSAVTGQELGRVRAGSDDQIRIDNENVTLIGMRRLSSNVETAFGADVAVYPNPAAEIINVKYSVNESSNVTIEVINTLGKSVMVDSFSADADGTRELKVDNLVNGTYMVRIVSGENTVIVPVTIAK